MTTVIKRRNIPLACKDLRFCKKLENGTNGDVAQRQLRRTVNPLPLGSLVRVQASPPFARVAQSVEHFVGNEEVTGSSPVAGSISSVYSPV